MNGSPAEARWLVLLLRQTTWRHWRRRLGSTLLLVGILALGVGVFLSIRLASRAAVSGFSLFTESLTGESDFLIRPVSGDSLPEMAAREVRQRFGALPVTILPVVEATAVEVAQTPDAAEPGPLRLLGVDLVALRNAAGDSVPEVSGDVGLGRDDQAFVSPDLASRHGLSAGSVFDLSINERRVSLRVAGVLRNDPLRPAVPPHLLLMDLPGLQQLIGRPEKLSRLEIRVADGIDAERWRGEARRILASAASDQGWRVETPEDRREAVAKMSRAFRLNLTVLSTLALLVGVYLIFQALEAAVVRRRSEMAILRSLGVGAGTIRRLWLLESTVLGMLGGGLGVWLGWAAAQMTVGGVARTVNSLYHDTATRSAALHPTEAIFGLGFGILASLAAGWLPARDAAETPPAQMLRSGARAKGLVWLARPGWGVVVGLVAFSISWLPPWRNGAGDGLPVAGYASALLWLAALSMMAGLLFRPLSRWLGGMGDRHPSLMMAGSQLRRPTGRHRLAVAGLVAATGMSAGMGVLVHSFEGTLTGWIGQMLRADLYVAPAAANQAGAGSVLPAAVWRPLAADPDVAGVDTIRRLPVEYGGRTIRLAGSAYHEDAARVMQMRWIEAPEPGRTPQALRSVADGADPPAWINEAMSRRFGLGRGDAITVPTPAGEKTLSILGVYADYSDEGGTVLTKLDRVTEWFGDDGVSNLAAYLKPGVNAEVVRARWQAALPAASIRENARLRADALRVFRETFAVTYSLEAIGVAVAVIGLGLALASLLVERRDELATLKSIGFTRGQIASSAAVEGAVLAAMGLVAGLILSLVLGDLLIRVINRQSFGWTLDYRVPAGLFIGLSLITLLTSAAVSAWVGARSARLKGDRRE